VTGSAALRESLRRYTDRGRSTRPGARREPRPSVEAMNLVVSVTTAVVAAAAAVAAATVLLSGVLL